MLLSTFYCLDPEQCHIERCQKIMNNLLSSRTVINNLTKQHDLAITLRSYFATISWEVSIKDFPWHKSSRSGKLLRHVRLCLKQLEYMAYIVPSVNSVH